MIRTVSVAVLTCILFSENATAMASASSAVSPETINEIAMMPGVERLSYISNKYYGVRPAYDTCAAETKKRGVDQGDCADTEWKYQDARLNKCYKTLLARLAGTDKQAAIDAQRAWLAFVAKDCSARADRFGSNNAPSQESICRMESTAIRAQQLDDWLSSIAAQKLP